MRSVSNSIGAIVGNDILDRADALVVAMRVREHLRDDARQEAALALLEGEDPERAIRRFVTGERSMGMTGGGTRPTVLRFTPEDCDQIPDEPGGSEEERVDAMADKLAIAGAVLVKLNARQRKILVLATLGWTHDEIAEHVGIARQNVSKTLERINRQSREMLRGRERPTHT